MYKFLGQGLNTHHSSDPSHSSNIARPLITRPPGNSLNGFVFFFFFSLFFQPHLQLMEVPRLRAELELQLPAYATATATPDPTPSVTYGIAGS